MIKQRYIKTGPVKAKLPQKFPEGYAPPGLFANKPTCFIKQTPARFYPPGNEKKCRA